MLHGLASKPEILNAVTMLSAGGLDLRSQAPENPSGRAVNRQKRLTFETAEGRQPPLASAGIGSNLCAEAQLRQRDRRDKDRLGPRLDSGERKLLSTADLA